MTSNQPPQTIGFYIFRGARHIRNATYEHIAEPVQIVEYYRGAVKELAVCMTGRSDRFQLARFEGEWTEMEGL